MSRIKGLNDKQTLKRKAIQPAITVWKGAKKEKNRAGQSLREKFRIEAPAQYRRALCKAYQTEEVNGSIFVDRLHIVPAYEDPEQAFDSRMAAYNASRPILFCDRQRIHTQFIEQKDMVGNIHFQPVEADEPCPVAGTNFDCPNKCGRTGDFYFYIFELLQSGYGEFARLRVGGVEDNQHIADVLDRTQESIGSIRNSPFVSEATKSAIVYLMTRRPVQASFPIKENGLTTNKRGKREDWVVNLILHPIWLNRYYAHLQAKDLRSLNFEPSMRLIEEVHGKDTVALPSKTVSALPSSRLSEFKSELAQAYINNGWDKTGWRSMMLKTFKTTEVSEDLDLDLLMNIAKEERDLWCDF